MADSNDTLRRLRSEEEKPPEFRIVRAGRVGRGLTHELVELLSAKIRTKVILPGDRLPSETEIVAAYGVSRSVVREALSRLQAAGLVETFHGVGTFALQERNERLFQLRPAAISDSVDMLEMLELRTGLESEAAGLAALRRSDEQLAEMRQALDDFERHVSVAGDTVSPDFRFHLAIARSTGNRYVIDLMSQLGLAVIPRTRISATFLETAPRSQQLHKVHNEHQDIYDAIARRDASVARAAMLVHLVNSLERQRQAYRVAEKEKS